MINLNSGSVCGESDIRNMEYEKKFTPRKFYDFLIDTGNPLIFDVGAHQGESIGFYRSIYPESVIYAFEPSPENFSELSKSFGNTHGVKIFEMALGKIDRSTKYFKQDISHMGGLLPINKESNDSIGYAENAKNEPINILEKKLDTFCKDNDISKIDILKIDTQGYEFEVLQGAESMLQKTSCVNVEVALYDLYVQEQKSNILNVEKIMCDNGFALWDIAKISKNPKTFRTDWVELVYCKRI